MALPLLAAACALTLASSCSHKAQQSEDSVDAAATAPADPNALPVAGTDAAPQPDAAAPKVAEAPPAPPKKPQSGKKVAAHRSHKSHAAPHAPAQQPVTAAAAQPVEQPQAPAPTTPMTQPTTQNTAPAQNPAPAAAASTETQQQPPSRAPASPRNTAMHTENAAVEPVSAENGGMMDTLMAYRSSLIAACALILVGGGGFAFWKRKSLEA